MKIAWFTPFSTESAIAKCSRLITGELAKLTDVDLWCPDAPEIQSTKLRVFRFGPSFDLGPDALSGYDIVVYNLGNHLPFHRQIFEMSRKAPGIVILHDFV